MLNHELSPQPIIKIPDSSSTPVHRNWPLYFSAFRPKLCIPFLSFISPGQETIVMVTVQICGEM